jgi:hypothetical protein
METMYDLNQIPGSHRGDVEKDIETQHKLPIE